MSKYLPQWRRINWKEIKNNVLSDEAIYSLSNYYISIICFGISTVIETNHPVCCTTSVGDTYGVFHNMLIGTFGKTSFTMYSEVMCHLSGYDPFAFNGNSMIFGISFN